MGVSALMVVWEGGGLGRALSGRHGRRLPWKHRDSASEGWRRGGLGVTLSEVEELKIETL